MARRPGRSARKFLLDPVARVEDHFNTGFLFARPRARVLRLLAQFLDFFHEESWRGVPRDFFDQRAMNKFMLGRRAQGCLRVVNLEGPRAHEEEVLVEVLDPAVVMHGMNFFWRRAHLLSAGVSGS